MQVFTTIDGRWPVLNLTKVRHIRLKRSSRGLHSETGPLMAYASGAAMLRIAAAGRCGSLEVSRRKKFAERQCVPGPG
jgi:hypothetical protein